MPIHDDQILSGIPFDFDENNYTDNSGVFVGFNKFVENISIYGRRRSVL